MAGLSDPASPGIRANYAIYRGGWLGIVNHALESFSGQWPMTLMLSAFDTLGFMLLGMAMVKGGFLTGRWDLEQYRRTARHCFLIGLPPMIALCAFIIAGGFAPLRSFTAYIAWSFPFRIPLTVGWAALILWLFGRYRQAPIFRRLGAAGRLALSNYLGSSILMTAIFYGWGLGLFGRVPLAALPLFVLGGWLVMLVWSPAWEARWGAGPMERLWRKMIRIGR
jgi:uncharacterized protein